MRFMQVIHSVSLIFNVWPWYLQKMVAQNTVRTNKVIQVYQFVEGIWLHRKSRQIGKDLFYVICELPSYIITMQAKILIRKLHYESNFMRSIIEPSLPQPQISYDITTLRIRSIAVIFFNACSWTNFVPFIFLWLICANVGGSNILRRLRVN